MFLAEKDSETLYAVLAPASSHPSHTLKPAIVPLVWFCVLSVVRAEVVSNALSSGGCGVPHGGIVLENLHLGPVATSSGNTKHGVFDRRSKVK